MVSWAKALTGKPDNLGSVPGTHMAEGEKQLPRVVPCHTCAHTQIQNIVTQQKLNKCAYRLIWK